MKRKLTSHPFRFMVKNFAANWGEKNTARTTRDTNGGAKRENENEKRRRNAQCKEKSAFFFFWNHLITAEMLNFDPRTEVSTKR
jgi:hypothetical protein